MDLLHKALKFIDHNRYTVFGLVMAIAAAAWLVGCAPTTWSIATEGKRVDSTQLQAEVVAGQADLAARAAELQRQAAILEADYKAFEQASELAADDIADKIALRQQVLDILGAAVLDVANGDISLGKLAVPAVSILGLLGCVGAAADNQRKNAVIANKTDEAAKANNDLAAAQEQIKALATGEAQTAAGQSV